MEIQLATVDDVKTIKYLAETIWPNAYGAIVSGEQIDYMLQLIYSENALIAQMQKGHQFLLVVHENKPIGYASFSPKSVVENTTFRLHKIYVLPNQTVKQIGSFLLKFICEAAKNAGAHMLELNVNKQNPAINFYKKNAFSILKEEVIDIGNGYVMDDYVMVKMLK